MKPVVAVLGGSTPFTAALVEALRELPSPCELRLLGQDSAALARMAAYGCRRLEGWTVRSTPRLAEAVDGAEIVVNQIRFGGMEGRARDEELALRFGLSPDETLGPSALSCALRVVPRVRELGAELGRRCPHSWVLNLSNPLSLTTWAMLGAGAPRNCVGLCELPLSTVLETCRVLGMSIGEVEWDYVGLNHRGFVVALEHRGEDILPGLPDLLGDRTIFGVSAGDIRAVGAVPLKYFRVSTRAAAPQRRARILSDLKEDIAREIDARVDPPPSLGRRDLSWYAGAVVPAISAILQGQGERRIVNCLSADGLVREVPARLFRDRFEPIARDPTPGTRGWLSRWVEHERALMAAIDDPSVPRIEQALQLDPAVPGERVRDLARAVMGRA